VHQRSYYDIVVIPVCQEFFCFFPKNFCGSTLLTTRLSSSKSTLSGVEGLPDSATPDAVQKETSQDALLQ
jgi:hypothetical protein